MEMKALSLSQPHHLVCGGKGAAMVLFVVGHPGTDGPGAWFDGKHWHPLPGWEARDMEIVRSALAIANEAVGVRDAAMQKQAFEVSSAMLRSQADYLNQ